MKSSLFILKEHFNNLYLMKRLAQFEMKISNKNNYLGTAWELINPSIQIFMYWFIFGLGFRNNRTVENIPFIFWLIVGISMWFFVNQGIDFVCSVYYNQYISVLINLVGYNIIKHTRHNKTNLVLRL